MSRRARERVGRMVQRGKIRAGASPSIGVLHRLAAATDSRMALYCAVSGASRAQRNPLSLVAVPGSLPRRADGR